MRAKRCFYSGVELTEPGAQSLMTDRSIDRIDADRPYESGNVVACCHKMNLLKSSFERVEHKVLVKMIKTITNSHSRRLSKS